MKNSYNKSKDKTTAFTIQEGKTSFIVRLHFKEDGKKTFDDMLKTLIKRKVLADRK